MRKAALKCVVCGCSLSVRRAVGDYCRDCRDAFEKGARAIEKLGQLSDATPLGALARLVRNVSGVSGVAALLGVEVDLVQRWVLMGHIPRAHADRVMVLWGESKRQAGVPRDVQAGRPRVSRPRGT